MVSRRQALTRAHFAPGASVAGVLAQVDEGVLLTVWVVPGARRDEVVGVHGDALKVRVAAPAEGGRANEAMLRLLSSRVGGECSLRRGATSRRKTVLVEGNDASEVARALGLDRAEDHREEGR
ncbi:MAG: YggU family protein [Acidimicrobiia bacterium]|nr:YggU family protein [Acidimicrobiia bacterium]